MSLIRTRKDEEFSPRGGILLKPQENISIYASYSESFLPRSGEQFANINGSNNVLQNSASSPSSSMGVAASTNCSAYSNTGIPTTCNLSNTHQMAILQPGTGLNTSGGTIQLVATMETSNSQRDEFIANSTSNNSATNVPQSM